MTATNKTRPLEKQVKDSTVVDAEEDDDEEDDDDTVVGTCLHCNSPPPPRSRGRNNSCGISAFASASGPCPASNPAAAAALSAAGVSPTGVTGGGTRVQVSCDDCRAFICDACHWCHEFQANHEIRVCDRCDAFYCRACDEMDQCEDCSEVVCNTCSTLMSCKFCGCGLCEDCATACGRCGIVLCARDAKFAVECDTCKMSYCLVCLASGTKDPCVRCGHRPSKRVEQLVHLRLKSIYKAFKQSGASVGSGASAVNGSDGGSNSAGSGSLVGSASPVISSSGGGGTCSHSADGTSVVRNGAGRDISTIGGKYSSALRSLTENESLGLRGIDSAKDSFCNFDQSMANEVAAVLQTASNAMANSDGCEFGEGQLRRTRGKRISSHSAHDHGASAHGPGYGTPRSHRSGAFSGHTNPTRSSNSAAERYFRKTQAEIEAAAAAAEAEAEAAAAALLAELDEEKATSNTGKSKKSKKKKKKKDKKQETNNESAHSNPKSNSNTSTLQKTLKKSSVEEGHTDSSMTIRKRKSQKKSSNLNNSTKVAPPIVEESSDEEEINFEQLVGRPKSASKSSKKEQKEYDFDENDLIIASNKPKVDSIIPGESTSEFDKELAELLSNDDEDGLEKFLANLRGVPGLAALRKHAKKALKRIKEEKELSAPSSDPEKQLTFNNIAISSVNTPEVELTPTTTASKALATASTARSLPSVGVANTLPTPNSTPVIGTPHEPLLRVVSRTQSTVGGASSRGSTSTSTSVPASARAECVMHMSPSVVGWVIGKGGQRIRDMMEESGAKIWIDQESMGPKESRVVYVSGKRSAVDLAVRMVKDLVSKAPVAASAAAAQAAMPVLSAVAPSAALSSKVQQPAFPLTTVPLATQNIALEATKEQPSFAAAITAHQSSPILTVQSVTKASSAVKSSTPTQGWAISKAGGNFPPAHVSSTEPTPQSVIGTPSKSCSKIVVNAQATTDKQPEKRFPLTEDKVEISETVQSELVCDPRFVALLIGRRGWTMKNIQAESGASLHIDQSIEPTKIIISGKDENVTKAKQLVHEILNYPQMQIHQESTLSIGEGTQGTVAGALSFIEPGPLLPSELQESSDFTNEMSLKSSLEHRSGVGRTKTNEQSTSSLPLSAAIHRDSFLSPEPIEGARLQHQHHSQTNKGEASDGMSFPPGYNPYQTQGNLGLFQDSSSAASFLQSNQQNSLLPPRYNSSPAIVVDPSICAHRQDWAQCSQPQMSHQYASLVQYSSTGQVNGGDHILQCNPFISVDHQSPQNKMSIRPHIIQNMRPLRQSSTITAQDPSDGLGGFLFQGSPSQRTESWALPATNTPAIGKSWHQNRHTSVPSAPQHSGYLSQPRLPLDVISHPPSDETFKRQEQNSHDSLTSEVTNNPISDDSQFVDSMFDSLSGPGADGDGLLNALNSVSLGGTVSQRRTWGNAIASWGNLGEEADSSSFLQHSRLGGIGLNSVKQDNHSHHGKGR